MARNTTNLGLNVWNNADDPYDHSQLAANWDAVDSDDHSSHPIGTTGLANGSVTNAKLAPNAVASANIVNATIQGTDIAPGTITGDLLSPGLFDNLSPLGQTTPWFRPTTSVSVPTGWAIADGSILSASQHGWGSFSVTLPDLRNKFVLGAAVSGTGTGTSTPPAEKATGGSHTRDLEHAHALTPHTHTIDAHTHTTQAHTHTTPGHSHSLSNHAHTIQTSGGHTHGFVDTNVLVGRRVIPTEEVNENTLHTMVPGGRTDVGGDINLASAGSHNHSGATGGGGSATLSNNGGTSGSATAVVESTGLTTNSSGAATTEGPQSITSDFRPAYVGLLYITKVKNA